ncbi:MAG: nitrous oxide-stimulated promoter family protein [Planctomycetota bacterium]
MARKHSSLDREKKTLTAMVRIYCNGRHAMSRSRLCQSCDELMQYSLMQIDKCPFGAEKGICSQCHVHCYKPAMRKRIREVMRYAGPRMITRHPILAANHLLKKWKHRVKKRKVESGN